MAMTGITVSKTSGTGNATVTVTSAPYTGTRDNRGSIVVKNTADTNLTKTVNITVQGGPTSLLLTSSPAVIWAASQTNRVVTITITTNASYLIWEASHVVEGGGSVGLTSADILLTAQRSPGKEPISNNVLISGDPGSTAAFNVVFSKDMSHLSFDRDVTVTFKIKGKLSPNSTPFKEVSVSLLIKARLPRLSVSPASMTFPAAGGSQTLTITTPDGWTIT